MPSLAKSSKRSSLSKGSLLTWGGIGLVLLAFIFLPEILFIENDNAEVAEYQEQEVDFEVVAEQPAEQGFQGDNAVANQLALEQAEQQAAGNARASLAQSAEMSPLTQVSDTEKDRFFPDQGTVSWDTLLERQKKLQLKKSKKAAAKILKSLDVRRKRSIAALTEYINQIHLFAETGGGKYKTVNEGLNAIAEHDLKVTRALAQDGVTRYKRMLWSKSTLPEGIQSPVTAKQRLRIIPKFRPDPQIEMLRVVQRKWSRGFSSYYQDQPVHIRIKGTVFGKEVKSIELIPSSLQSRSRRVHLNRSLDFSGRREFRAQTVDDSLQGETFTLRLIDIDGNTYQKSYRFYPRVTRFTWLGEKGRGRYAIPFRPRDPRMDAFFRVSNGSGQNRRNSGTSSFFGGKAIGRF